MNGRILCREVSTMMAWWLAKARVWAQDERGLGLAESVVAVAIVSVTAVAFMTALSTASLAVREADYESVAQRLAMTQLEYVKSLPYDTTGSTYSTVDTPAGFSISIEVDSRIYADSDIQELTVTVSRDAEEILLVTAYKVNR